MFIQIIKDMLKNLRSLTFAENDIEKNVEERVLFKNYKERFERSLHQWEEEEREKQQIFMKRDKRLMLIS